MDVRGWSVLAAAVAAGCAADARDVAAPVTLRFRPAAGTSTRHAFEQHLTMRSDSGTPLPPQDVTMRIYLTQAVGDGRADGIPVTSTVDSVTLSNSALPVTMLATLVERVRGLRTLTVLDARMRPVHYEIVNRPDLHPDRLAPFEQGARGFAFPLPEGPVRVGDTWTVAVPLPTGPIPGAPPALEAPTTLTLRAVRVSGSDTTVVLGVEARFPEAPITVDFGVGKSSLRLSGTLVGHQEFSLSRGTVVGGTMAGVVRIEMTGGIAGDRTLGVTLDQRLTLRTLEGP
jgi:hypothetical protein